MTTAARRVLDSLPTWPHRVAPANLRADLRYRTGRTVPGDLGHRASPPAPAPGERTGPPDFAVIDAGDSGGRWWMSSIERHPDVAPARGMAEAAHWFAPYATEPFGPSDVATFHAWFPRQPGRHIGWWSEEALAHPWVPALLAAAAPGVRVVVVVRDPVDRLLDGLDRTADERPAHVGAFLSDAVDRGLYAPELAVVHRAFGAANVLVQQVERCMSDPAGELDRAATFLGLDPSGLSGPAPDGPGPRRPARDRVEPDVLRRLQRLYAADVAALEATVTGFDRSLWPDAVADA